MSFWRSFTWHSVSPVDTLLDKNSFTLEELLDEDELLSELKSQNRKLVNYINKEETLLQLVNYVVTEPATEKDYKYAYISTEIICADNWSINETLFQSQAIWDKLFQFVYQPNLPTVNALHFGRVSSFFIGRKPNEISVYLISKNDFLQQLLNHIHLSPIIDLLTKILAIIDHVDNNIIANWFIESNLVPSLVDRYDRKNSEEIHENISLFFLHLIARSCQIGNNAVELCKILESENTIRTMINHLLSPPDENTQASIISGLEVLAEIVKKYYSDLYDYETPVEQLPDALRVILENLDKFITIITTFSEGEGFIATFGELKTPFGSQRMKVLELLVGLISTRFISVISNSIEKGLLRAVIDLIFKYPWNNILHIAIQQIICTMIESEFEPILTSIFKDEKLHEHLAKAGNAEVEGPANTRKGYMGIVTLLANSIENVSLIQTVKDSLDSNEEWQVYINGELAETRKKESSPIGGGNNYNEDDQNFENAPVEEEDDFVNFNIASGVRFAFENGLPTDFAIKDFEDEGELINFSYNDEKLLAGIPSFQEGDGSIKFFDFFGTEMEGEDGNEEEEDSAVPVNDSDNNESIQEVPQIGGSPVEDNTNVEEAKENQVESNMQEDKGNEAEDVQKSEL